MSKKNSMTKRHPPNFKDLNGKRFGMLLVVSYAGMKLRGKRGDPRSTWNTVCDCGTEKVIVGDDMTNGKTRTCASHGKPKGNKSARWKGYEGLSSEYFTKIKSSAKRRNLEFSVTIKDLWNLYLKQKGLCKLSGIPIEILALRNHPTASLDRIDSDLGYTIENVQWVHKDINRIKTDLKEDYFVELCTLISSNLSTKISSK
jgi:hypothetical protein